MKTAKVSQSPQPYLDFTRDMVKELGQAVRPLVQSPAFHIVAATVLIEYLQRMYVGTGRYSWQSQPNTHALVWKEETSPLISQSLATTMEGVIISTEALKSIGNIIDELIPFVGAR